MLLRRFTQAGLELFRAHIKTLVEEKKKANKSSKNLDKFPAPYELLEDEAMSEVVTPNVECPDATFDNRLSAALYLEGLLAPIGLADSSDVKLWSWLALRFYSELMPFSKAGVPLSHLNDLGVDEARFIPSSHYTDSHRHLLRHPLQIYRSVNGEVQNALCFLLQPVYRPGDIVEQFGSRQLYSHNKEMVATMSALIVDTTSMKIRLNASSKARRLDEVLDQFDCTWDLGFIAKDLLIPMLPDNLKNFQRAKSKRKVRK